MAKGGNPKTIASRTPARKPPGKTTGPSIVANTERRRTLMAQPIARMLHRMLKSAPVARSARGLAALKRDWADVAGPEFAQAAWPERLDPARNGRPGVLSIKAAAGAALLIQHDGPRLIERVNGYLGSGAIARIKIVPGLPPNREPRKMPPEPIAADDPRAIALEKRGKSIGSDRLADALTRLGRAVAARK